MRKRMRIFVVRQRENDHWVNRGVITDVGTFEDLWADPTEGWLRVGKERALALYGSTLPVYSNPEEDSCLALDEFEISLSEGRLQ